MRSEVGESTGSGGKAKGNTASSAPAGGDRLVAAETAFLRFAAGCRALLAVLAMLACIAVGAEHARVLFVVILAYMAWSGSLLWLTLNGWPLAASRGWLWIDAVFIVAASRLLAVDAPLLGLLATLPVVALAVLAGARPALTLALASAAALLATSGALGHWPHATGPALLAPLLLLVISPAAALLTRPSRELRERLLLVEAFHAQSDPRQGLCRHVDRLLQQLAAHCRLDHATLSLQGPEPRIFQWQPGRPVHELGQSELEVWQGRLSRLPTDRGCLCTPEGRAPARITCHDPTTGARMAAPGEDAAAALRELRSEALTLPLMSYGQELGMLCLRRDAPAFNASDLRWLRDVMREAIPLLERTDLLEQLERESATRERERIGRDLHDSAVQPYLGLKYGLEALARQAGPHNVVSGSIQQLLRIAGDELQTLRDVVSGLRSGADPGQSGTTLATLERQAQRFQALFGLKVNIFASRAPRLRGAVAKALLHMVNEALTNIRRHTSATAVTVFVDVRDEELVLRLRNDHGRGEPLLPDFLPRSLSERAAEFRGSVDLNHHQDHTEMTITLPLMAAIA